MIIRSFRSVLDSIETQSVVFSAYATCLPSDEIRQSITAAMSIYVEGRFFFLISDPQSWGHTCSKCLLIDPRRVFMDRDNRFRVVWPDAVWPTRCALNIAVRPGHYSWTSGRAAEPGWKSSDQETNPVGGSLIFRRGLGRRQTLHCNWNGKLKGRKR